MVHGPRFGLLFMKQLMFRDFKNVTQLFLCYVTAKILLSKDGL